MGSAEQFRPEKKNWYEKPYKKVQVEKTALETRNRNS